MNNLARITLLLIATTVAVVTFGQNKVPLNHEVYDSWKSIGNKSISTDGSMVSYEINPQEGDGSLYLYEVDGKSVEKFERGSKAQFGPNSNFMIFKILPQFDTIRSAKLKKVKKDDMSKDSLGIYDFKTGGLKKVANVKSFRIPREKSDWIAYEVIVENNIKRDSTQNDSTKVAKKKKKSKKDKKSTLLVLYNPITGDSVAFKNIETYDLSKNGETFGIIQKRNDSIDSIMVSVFNTKNKTTGKVFSVPGYSKKISVDNKGDQLAFTYSNDTSEIKTYTLLYYNTQNANPEFVVDTTFSNLKKGWSVSEFANIYFNDDDSELYFGTSIKPEPKVNDTLTKDEKVSVDIWNWKDMKLQPQQLKELDREKKRSYTAVYFPETDKVIQLADSSLPDIRIDKKAKGKYSLAYNTIPYQRMTSWEASRYRDVYLVDRTNGEKELILEKIASTFSLSPDQKSVVYYMINDSSWNIFDINSRNHHCLTCDMNIPFYNVLNDVPNEANPYGFCGWTKNGNLIIYDEFDLWKFDADGNNNAVNITNSYGRKNNVTLRYIKLDKEEVFLPKNMILKAFNNSSKAEGFFNLKDFSGNDPALLIMKDEHLSTPLKAKNDSDLIFTRSTFRKFPDLYLSDVKFDFMTRITDANPQQDKYLWGDVKLVNWITFEGDTMDGLLYIPGDFDPSKKYPMLVYFYERSSQRLNYYYSPKPIRSVINFSYYASNGYVIFVPDIKYKEGYPGASAYDCVVSGTQAMVDEYDFIDRNNIGIQGQSWGGYQVAYLVTRTNMYKAAMAGAPVSNMTSAYGGIRWGSGLSRAFQYEQTQSRIGGSLWDEMPLYLENSPLFYANRVETPLLIMHNDEDGAVPWYQGIELFNALRRLNKPVWMLVYNGAPHNLKRRADCKDLTIRMQQFFDHYLKGAPEPVWMKYGIPAVQKGKTFGFDLVK